MRKTVTTARLTPLLVALYANSPLVEGRDTGLVSFRSKVWTEVDPARCGYLRSWLDGSFSYRATWTGRWMRRCSSCAAAASTSTPSSPSASCCSRASRASPRTWRTGRTTSPRCSPRCGSRR